MAETHVISALVKLKSEMEGQFRDYQKKSEKIYNDLTAINKTIKICNPNYELEKVRIKKIYKKNRYFERYECQRLILDVLKEHDTPITSSVISKRLKEMKNITITTTLEKNSFSKNINNSLKVLKSNNLIEQVGIEELSYTWKIKPMD